MDTRSEVQTCASPWEQRGTPSNGLRRDCGKGRAHWRKWKGSCIAISHWLSYSSLPLAELLLGRKEPFLPPAELVASVLLEMLVCLYLSISGTHGVMWQEISLQATRLHFNEAPHRITIALVNFCLINSFYFLLLFASVESRFGITLNFLNWVRFC